MSGDTPTSFEDAANLRRRLRELGNGPTNPARSDELERNRADRIAASLDSELRQLVRRRARARLAAGVALASAAVVLLMLGFRGRSFESRAIIAREQLPPAPVAQKTAASPLAVPTSMPSAVVQPRQPVRRSSSSVAVPAPAPSLSVAPQQARGRLGEGDAAARGEAPPAEARSTLGEENRLFQDAAEASRRGDVGGAVGLLDKLLVDFPRSPLAQTALVRKFRLLAKAGRSAEAAREAERYLKSYPTGFAVSEARGLQGTAPGPSTTSTTDTGSEP